MNENVKVYLGFIAGAAIGTIIGAFIGATAVYAILTNDIYTFGACFIGIVIGSILLAAMNRFNVKKNRGED